MQELIDIDECEEFAASMALQMMATFNHRFTLFNGWHDVVFARRQFQWDDFCKRATQVIKNHALTDLLMDDQFNQHKRHLWAKLSLSVDFWDQWYQSPLFETNKKYSVLDCQNQIKHLEQQGYIGDITLNNIRKLKFVVDCGGALGMSTGDLINALDEQCKQFVIQTPDIRQTSVRTFKI